MPYGGEAARLSNEIGKYRSMIEHCEEIVHKFIDPTLLSDEERGRLEREIREHKQAWHEELRILNAEWHLLWGGNGFIREGMEGAFRYACQQLREQYRSDHSTLDRVIGECKARWEKPLEPKPRRRKAAA